MSGWTWLWLGWLLAFLAIELPALRNRTAGDTLSEQVWRLLRWGRPATPATKLRRLAFVAFWAWLTVHFFTRGWM